jgi:hypothetical protein
LELGSEDDFSMNSLWQEATTAAILLLAIGYVVRRVVRFIRRKGMPDCCCCPKCPAQKDDATLVAIADRTGRSEQKKR